MESIEQVEGELERLDAVISKKTSAMRLHNELLKFMLENGEYPELHQARLFLWDYIRENSSCGPGIGEE